MNEIKNTFYPKISVVTPSYNQGKFLEKTILSVLSQEYPNLEYIIMDGGSSDNSVEIIKKYQDKLAYWQSKPDGGQSAAINEGFRRATGDIYCWLNSDDLFVENTLSTVGLYFKENIDCNWIAGITRRVDIKGNTFEIITPKKLDFSTLFLWDDNMIYQPAVFWKKYLWAESGGLDERLNSSMDFDLWLRFSKISIGEVIDKELAVAVSHKKAKTVSYVYENSLEFALVLVKHGDIIRAKSKLISNFRTGYKINKSKTLVVNSFLYKVIKSLIAKK